MEPCDKCGSDALAEAFARGRAAGLEEALKIAKEHVRFEEHWSDFSGTSWSSVNWRRVDAEIAKVRKAAETKNG